MSQTKGLLASLPMDIGHGIAALISPLSRASLGRAFARGASIFNFTETQKRSARVWDMIFKDESWLQAISNVKYYTHPPNPTLVGYDLTELYYGSSTSAYIALLISDWGEDCKYLKRDFFASLREHDYDEQAFEVRFKDSNIILNVRDAVTSPEWLEMGDPRRLFRCHKQNLQTAVLYFKDDLIKIVGPEKIGRVNDMPMEKKKCVEDICSLQLKFGDGTPVYRVIRRRDIPVRLVSIYTTDENGRKWVTSWRLARAHEVSRQIY